MRINIGIDVDYEGFARKLFEVSEQDLLDEGVKNAVEKAKDAVRENFDTVGHGSWPLTQDGRSPLLGGVLKANATDNADVVIEDDGFEMTPSGDPMIADVQHNRYGYYELTEEAQAQVAQAFGTGLLEE